MSSCPEELKCFEVNFEANPDIAGIGVIVAFLISAWSSLLIITIEYCSLGRDDLNLRFTLVDELFNEFISKFTRRLKKPWALESIQPAVLMVSDQQLVTGISIMSVGYIQRCTITRYHFYIIYLLGFISCQIYDASLCVLNLYVNKRRAMKIWRAILMSVLFGMVIINSFVVENDDFLTDDGETWYFGSSTQCTWNNLVGTDHYQHDLWILIVTLGVLFWGYLEDFRLFYPGAFWWLKWVPRIFQLPLSSLLRLYGWIDKQTREPQQLYTGPRHIDEEARPIVAHVANFFRRVLLRLSLILMQSVFWILFIPTFTSMEVLRSRTTSIWRIYLGLFWASMQVLRTKANARSSNVIKGSEDEWGFGQVLPLLLLILPAMSLLEVYQEAQEKKGGRDKKALETDSESHSLTLPASNQGSVCDEPITLSPSPSSRTEYSHTDFQENDVHRQQGRGIENRLGFLDNGPDTMAAENIRLDLPARMYKSTLFRVWISLCVLLAFAGATYAAIQGYAF